MVQVCLYQTLQDNGCPEAGVDTAVLNLCNNIMSYLIIGINVRKGKGRYRDTHIVTFAPRYLLDNRSSHKLAFSQREFVRGKVGMHDLIVFVIVLCFRYS